MTTTIRTGRSISPKRELTQQAREALEVRLRKIARPPSNVAPFRMDLAKPEVYADSQILDQVSHDRE